VGLQARPVKTLRETHPGSLFTSYARVDGTQAAIRLRAELEHAGFFVWQHEAVEEQSRAEELREVAKRLHGEALVVEAAASAVDKRAAVLSQQAVKLGAERATLEQQWSEAVERWEKLRYSLGLPFYDPEVGPPAWFTSPYEQQGLAKRFSAR
jgi:hypothetical protein